MQRAIELARGTRPHPNPSVGAVVVVDGDVIAEGFHIGPGEPHAEVVALDQAGERASGADLYVTLEPCSFHGRTPPCVDAIEAAGIRAVYVGAVDPDARVSGSGIEKLLQRGVEATIWDEPEVAESVDPAYFHHRRTGRALITWKYAMTLDGSVAAADHSSQWITSTEARADAHRMRSSVDAVMIGAGTLRADNPMLDVRLEGYMGSQPRPVVLAGQEPLPGDASIFDRDPLVFATREIHLPSGDLVVVPGDLYPEPAVTAAALADRGYLSVLLEGGSRVATSWLQEGLVDRGVVYIGALLGGGAGLQPLTGVFDSIANARAVEVVDVRSVGPDVRIEFR